MAHSFYYVEDVMTFLGSKLYDIGFSEVLPDPWHHKFIRNVSSWVYDGKPMTTEQARIVLRIAGKTRAYLIAKGGAAPEEIDRLIAQPRYRREPTLSASIPREVRYVGDNMLAFRFKRNDIVIDEIKALQKLDPASRDDIVFNHRHRIWMVPITRHTAEPVMALIGKHRFVCDEAVEQVLCDFLNSQGETSGFAYDEEAGVIRCNVRDNIMLAKWVTTALQGVRV